MKKVIFSLSVLLGILIASCSEKEVTPVFVNSELDGTKFITVYNLKEMIDAGDDLAIFGVMSHTKALLPLTDESSPIDGTLRVWRPDYSGKGSLEAISSNIGGYRYSKEQFEDLLSYANIADDTKIVVYSTGNMHDMARFGWQLELVGLEPMYLDGGLNEWKAVGFETGDAINITKQDKLADFKSDEWNIKELDASIEDVINALENPDEWVVIDTRSKDEYDGKKTSSSRGAYGTGAIKNTVHINWNSAINDDNTLLKTKAELQDIYSDVVEGKKVITFCQSGVRSSHTQLVLKEILNIDDVYNYDGSWIEWSYAASEVSDDVPPAIKVKVIEYTDKWVDNKGEI